MKKKIIIIAVVVVCVVLLVVGIVGYGFMNDARVKAARSITMIDEGLYTMSYEGDYGFDAFLEQGGAASDSALAQYVIHFLMQGFGASAQPDTTASYGCSTFVVHNEYSILFGRNFDFPSVQKAMIVKARPTGGYASISTACLDFMGMPSDWQPDGDIPSRMAALTALYLPLDGINEMGLCVADLVAGDEEETHQATSKPDLTTTTAVRLLLDKASNVYEAIELLRAYDMNTSIGTSHHLAIADATGASVVVEYIDGEMYVTSENIVTNHYLTPGKKCGVGNELSHERYNTISHMSSVLPYRTSPQRVIEILKEVSYPEFTQWSIVFDTEMGEARYVWKAGFDAPKHVFSIYN